MPLKGLSGCPVRSRKQLWSHCNQNLPTRALQHLWYTWHYRGGILAVSSVLSVHFEQKTQVLGDGSEISNEVKITAVLHQISSYFFNEHLL